MTPQWTAIADSVRSRTRRLVLLRGVAWMSVVVVALTWLAGVTDWGVHLDAPWVRLLLLSGIAVASLAVLWRAVLRPLLVHLSDVDVARLVESRLSQPEERLSSAAQFRAQQQNPALGSPELQRSTIAKADESLDGLDLDALFTKAPVRQALLTAAVVSMIALATVIAAPRSAWTALTRLTLPFTDVEWPRTTKLRLLSADLTRLKNTALRTTAGEPLTVYVENTLGTLPDDLTLGLRLPDDTEQQQSLRTTMLRDAGGKSHEVGIVSLLAYRGPVRFRVWGGDDDGTAWRTLDVVPAPTVAELSITVTPPGYSGREVQTLPGAGLIEGLVSSRVSITGQTNKPLESAALHREGEPPQLMSLNKGNREFQAEFDIEQPGPSWYWFELKDEHGLSEPDPPRYELRGIADRPPVVYIDEPAGDLTVTPAAELPLRVIARDDLGLTELRLRHTDAFLSPAADASEETPAPDIPPAETIPLTLSALRSVEETVKTTWRLEPLGLSPGARLTYWAEAVDACDLHAEQNEEPGQVGTSAQRHLDVISESDKQRELAVRQSGLLDTLDALRDRQAQARDITAQLRIQTELAQRLRPADVDLLKQAEWEQQSIRRQIADESSGLAQQVEELQRELSSNQIDDPETAQRLGMLADDLGELDRRWLPVIEQSLARARKSAGAVGDESEERDTGESEEASLGEQDAPRQLREAEEAQTSALAVLSEAAKLLGGWRQRFHLSSELDALVADQKQVQQETNDVGRETLAKAASRLSAQQQADLARLSDRQRRLAARLDQFLETPGSDKTPDGEGESAGRDDAPAVSPELLESQDWLREQGTAGEMHRAAESLKRNEIPAAARAQENVLAALRDFGERLHQTPFNDPETLLSELRDAREQAETLRKEQETLARSSQHALSPTADPLREEQLQRLIKQQSQLADEADEMARRLKRQQHADAARTADRAAQRMQDAHSALEQQQPEGVAVNQQEALDDLDQLANELAARQQQAEAELAEQQLHQLAGDLGELADEQQALREATTDLDARQSEHGSWSRSLKGELLELVGRQRQLHQQLGEPQPVLSDLPVVWAALEGAGEEMDRAAGLLDEEETGEAAAAQRAAEERLRAVAEVVSDTNAGDDSTPSSSPPGDDGESQSPATGLHITTQLKLLRRMQADINSRTTGLAQADEKTLDAAAIKSSQESLAREQGRIAEFSRTLLQQVIESQRPAPDFDIPPEEQP